MDAVQDVLADVSSTVTGVTDQVVAAYQASPIAEPLAGYYTKFLGDTSTTVFVIEIVPILYVTVLPLISMLFAMIGCCKGKKASVGKRILRRVGHLSGKLMGLQKGVKSIARSGLPGPKASPNKARAGGNPRRY